MRILFMAAEAAPLIKTGGLADVARALPRTLASLGHEVWLLVPHHRGLREPCPPLQPAIPAFHLDFDWAPRRAELRVAPLAPRLTLATLASPDYFDRPAPYGEPDDARRYIFFAKAGLEAVRRAGWRPEVLHAHDWHTAAAVNWLAVVGRRRPEWAGVGAVYTIHNLAYQGLADLGAIGLLGVEAGGLLAVERDHAGGQINLMARGIAYADIVTTVSPTYAREIVTPALGAGLHELLRARGTDLRGILNGLDPRAFDPAADPRLVACFTAESLAQRVHNKRAVQAQLGLPPRDWPLIGIVSRMTGQKGGDLIVAALEALMGLEAQLVVTGSGEPRWEELWVIAADRYHGRIGLHVGYDETLARRIYGGSDLFLMPSRYEPCGLSQMISMRYGSIPIVRATGGLADTVLDADTKEAAGTGFVFGPYEPVALLNTVSRALTAYHQPARWRTLVRRAMAVDHGWEHVAPRYVAAYEAARARASARR